MRKVTSDIRQAFQAGQSKKIGNTRTDGESVWLHGNKIVKTEGGKVFATLAGWNTPTTRERVNGICDLSFQQIDFGAFLDGEPVHPSEWVEVS